MPLNIGFSTRALARTVILASGISFAYVGSSQADICGLIVELEDFQQSATAPSDAVCRTFAGAAGSKGVFCWWSFSLRDVAAVDFAEGVWSSLKTCRSGTESSADLQVNHPDSYALREWVGEKKTYSVAVKDKVSQQKTLVFFRFQDMPAK